MLFIPNLKVLEPPANLQFVRHANWACGQSKGKYLLLLNNDTELKSRALEALVEVAEAHADVGLVGSKLIYPDGRLQEAGGIIWGDGSACNYGHADDPDRPEYNYVREAGYVSGASILIPRKIWDELGGFDERYAPAYCEDSDFAFRARERGLRVLYAPRSVVVHHEGVSHGTDLGRGVKAYQVRNMSIFYERWQEILTANYFPPWMSVRRARDGVRSTRSILILDHYVPEPDRDAGSRTMLDIIRNLQKIGFTVKFWPDNLHYSLPYTSDLQALGVEVFYGPYWNCLDDFLQTYSADLDLVLLSRPTFASKAIQSLKLFAPGLPIVFYGHDLHGKRMRVQADATKDVRLRRDAQKMEFLERSVWRDVDVVTYPSLLEVQAVRSLEPSVVAQLLQPYCFDDFTFRRSPTTSQTILFVGGFSHPPNIDAVVWFAYDVWPLILKQVPQARLCVAGSNPSASVRALERDNIEVTGSLSAEALAEKYANARVAVVPLRFGAGVKLKVVEALQVGLPLVTTTVGAQGILGLDDIVPVKDEPHELAEVVVRLLSDDTLWVAQSHRQSLFAKERYSRAQAVHNIKEIVELALTCAGPRRSLGSTAAAG